MKTGRVIKLRLGRKKWRIQLFVEKRERSIVWGGCHNVKGERSWPIVETHVLGHGPGELWLKKEQGLEIPAATDTAGLKCLDCISYSIVIAWQIMYFCGLQVSPEIGKGCKQGMVVEVALCFGSGDRRSFAHVSSQSKCHQIKLSSFWELVAKVWEIVYDVVHKLS